MSLNPPRVLSNSSQIAKALLGIQESFEAQIEKLRNLEYTVLDVKTSRWHEDYSSFKDVVKNLEVILPRNMRCSHAGNETKPFLKERSCSCEAF